MSFWGTLLAVVEFKMVIGPFAVMRVVTDPDVIYDWVMVAVYRAYVVSVIVREFYRDGGEATGRVFLDYKVATYSLRINQTAAASYYAGPFS